MNKKQAVVMISGYNIRAVIAFCRWADEHSVRYHIVAKSKMDPIFLTDYKKYVEIIRESPVLRVDEINSWIKTLQTRYEYTRVLILPSTEFLNRFLLEKREELENDKCVIPLTSQQLYTQLSDKFAFENLCKSYGLDVPKRFAYIPKQIPFIAKPRTYLSSNGRQLIPQLLMNQQDLARFQETENHKDYYLQEYIKGKSLYLLLYIQKSGHDILFSQENLMQQARGGSVILAKKSNFHDTEIAKRYIKMFHEIGFHGLIMVEVRLDEENGRYVTIEANPRLWGPIQFCVDNNIGLFDTMLNAYSFDIASLNPPPAITSHYFWSGGISLDSQPISYHNYSGEQFAMDFPVLRSQEIFFRKDTINLFLREAGYGDSHE